MKYWNKDKLVRQRCWHKVERTVTGEGYQVLKRRLQLQDSPGKFYLYYGSNSIWFEHEADAVWFRLKWS